MNEPGQPPGTEAAELSDTDATNIAHPGTPGAGNDEPVAAPSPGAAAGSGAGDAGLGDAGAGEAGPKRRVGAKAAASAAGIAVLVVVALFASNAFGLRVDLVGGGVPPPVPVATGRVAGGGAATNQPAPATVLRSQPWWQRVATFSGTGPTTTPAFKIVTGALQWRVTPTCATGNLNVTVSPATSHAKALIDAPCASKAPGYGVSTGPTRLVVTAKGPWHLVVDQQIDVPLVQAPTPAMSAPGAVVVSKGSFYNMDQSASGSLTIYRLANHSYALRLTGFFVTPNVNLELHLSPLKAPHSTSAYVAAPSAYVSALDVTAGSLNFAIPKGVDPTHYHSLVIWCQLLHSAYGAATLVPTKAAHTAKPSQTKPAHAKQAQAKATSTPTTKAG